MPPPPPANNAHIKLEPKIASEPASVPAQRSTPIMAQTKPATHLPAHMRSVPTHQAVSTPVNGNKARFAPPGGLNTPIQTPAPPPPLQRVPSLDDHEDSFTFSDDDALLATMDLGEGDIGRPIQYEDDFHNEASTLDTSSAGGNDYSTILGTKQQPVEIPTPIAPISNANGKPRSTHKPGYLASIIEAEQRRQQEEERQQLNRQPSSERSSVAMSSKMNQVPQVRQQPKTNNTSSSSSTGGRSMSAGGFHFPPGMQNPMNEQQPRKPSLNGIKRPADVAFE
jgi:DNA repair and recombination protein RAD52